MEILQGLFVGIKFGNLNLPSLSDTIFSLNFKRPTICNRRAVVKFFVIYAVYSRLAVYIHESVIQIWLIFMLMIGYF